MANPHRGEVMVELDRPRPIRFDLNTYAELEDTLGIPWTEIPMRATASAKRTRLLLWHGLRAADPDCQLTEQEVGALVRDTAACVALFRSLNVALGKSLPEPDPSAEGNATSGRGIGSKPSASPTGRSDSAPPSSGD